MNYPKAIQKTISRLAIRDHKRNRISGSLLTGFLGIVLLLPGCSTQPEPAYDQVINHVNLIDGTGREMQENVSVGIRDGRIAAIGTSLEGTGRDTIDGTGKYLIPGLFDGHVHTTDYQRDFPRFVHYGITSVFITGGSICSDSVYAAMRALGEQDSLSAPHVFHTSQHFTLEGRHPAKTYGSSNWRDGVSIFYLKDTLQIEALVDRVSQQPIAGIKLTIEDGPHPPWVGRMPRDFIDKTVREGARHGLEVFAHVSDNIELEMAITAGVQNLVHYTGVDIDPDSTAHIQLLETFRERDPSWVTTLMIDKSFLYPLHPEWFEAPNMLPEYKSEATVVDPERRERARQYLGILQMVYGVEGDDIHTLMAPQVADIRFLLEMGFNMVLGTDVGNTFIFPGHSLHEEMQLLESGGMDPLDILKMGTLNAARMLGAADDLGSLEVGKRADMVLLNANPLESIANTLAIDHVIKGGVVQERIMD